MRCSVYTVCPSVLSCSNLKLHQRVEVKNTFKYENVMLQLTFNPGLTLTGFQTTLPRVFYIFSYKQVLRKNWYPRLLEDLGYYGNFRRISVPQYSTKLWKSLFCLPLEVIRFRYNVKCQAFLNRMQKLATERRPSS